MMLMRKKIAGVLAGSLLAAIAVIGSGCVGTPTPEQIAAADYGAPLDKFEARAIGRTWLNQNLKDPGSAKIEWGGFYQSRYRTGMLEGFRRVWAYRLDAQINAKNSFGGYVGWHPYSFWIRDSRVLWVEGGI